MRLWTAGAVISFCRAADSGGENNGGGESGLDRLTSDEVLKLNQNISIKFKIQQFKTLI